MDGNLRAAAPLFPFSERGHEEAGEDVNLYKDDLNLNTNP